MTTSPELPSLLSRSEQEALAGRAFTIGELPDVETRRIMEEHRRPLADLGRHRRSGASSSNRQGKATTRAKRLSLEDGYTSTVTGEEGQRTSGSEAARKSPQQGRDLPPPPPRRLLHAQTVARDLLLLAGVSTCGDLPPRGSGDDPPLLAKACTCSDLPPWSGDDMSESLSSSRRRFFNAKELDAQFRPMNSAFDTLDTHHEIDAAQEVEEEGSDSESCDDIWSEESEDDADGVE